MDGARVRDQERPPKTLAPQRERGLDMGLRFGAPVGRERSARRSRERVEAKCHRARLRSGARALDQSGKMKSLVGAVRPKVQFESRPLVKTHAVDGFVKRGGVESRETKSISADRAGGPALQAIRPIGEIVERLGVGFFGAGMIESRDDSPRPAGPDRPRAFRWRIDG